jgi:predicted nucleic acid-binding protein
VAGLTLDAGALIAYERADPRIREILALAFARGTVPTVPAIALAETWRGDAKDPRVARLLKSCAIEPVSEPLARMAGGLRRSTPGAETIDACIAVGVRRRGDTIATSDAGDMRRLLGPRCTILEV